jgi:hypothetical protein
MRNIQKPLKKGEEEGIKKSATGIQKRHCYEEGAER